MNHRKPSTKLVSLPDDALGAVAGGDKKCDTAMNLSKGYTAIGDVFQAVGDSQMASYYYGKSLGVLEGGCGK